MIKLLRSEYRRLYKTSIFWLCAAGCCVCGMCLSMYMIWMHMQFDDKFNIDDNFFIFATFCGVLSAVFTSLFVGKLYSDGTMRNQIIMGHSRPKIYLCEYLVSFTGNALFFVFYLFGNTVVACPVFRTFSDTLKIIAVKSLITLAIIGVYTAIFVFIAMLNRNKTVTAIICLLTTFGLLFYSMIIETSLNEPEMFEAEYYFDADTNQIIKEDSMPNPNYIDGTKREVYEFLNDFLPAGQSFQVGGNYDKPNVNNIFFLYDSIIIAVTCLGAIIIYKRKDLK